MQLACSNSRHAPGNGLGGLLPQDRLLLPLHLALVAGELVAMPLLNAPTLTTE